MYTENEACVSKSDFWQLHALTNYMYVTAG